MQNRFIKHSLSIKVCALLLASCSLYSNETTKLDDVIISEYAYSKYQSENKPDLNRTLISKKDTPKAIQSFNKTFIQEAMLQNIEDVIEISSNTVYTGDFHGRRNDISMRGFSEVPILYDGLKVTNKLARPEIYNLDLVEVLKGPASLQYGQSSPGGLVNLVTKKPTKDSFAKLDFDVSDNPSYNPKMDIGGAITDDKSLYFRLVSSYKYDKGWTNANTNINKIFIAPSIAYDINDNNKFTFVSEYTNETTPSSFGTYTNGHGKFVTDIKNVLSHPDEKFKKTQKLIGFDLDSVFDTFSSNFKYRYVDYVGDNSDVHISTLGYNKATNSINRFWAYQKQEFQEHILQYTANKDINLFGFENRFTLGADYNKAYTTTHFFTKRPPFYSLNLSNLVYEPLTSKKDYTNIMDISTPKTYIENYGVFLNDNIYLSNNLIFSAGIRYDEVKPKNKKSSNAITPQLGLVYHLNKDTTLFTNYSESFTPTSRQDKDKKSLDPEKGKGFEVGIKQSLFDERFDLSASIFGIKKENVAILDIANSGGGTFAYKSSGEQQSYGFEFDINGDITDNLSLITSYGFTNTKDKDASNNRLINMPKHTANLFATYKLSSFNLPNYYIGGGLRYIGTKYADEANNIKLASATIYNATIGYKKDNFRANITIQNLTNEKYVEGAINASATGDWARVYTGTPRAIMASIGYTF